MAFVLADRVKDTTVSTGTGTITLAGSPPPGFQSFAAIGNANNTYYTIAGGAEWEVGIGTYTSAGTLLSRDTVLSSSNAGAAVNFSAGSKEVFVTYPSGKAVMNDVAQTLTNKTINATNNIVTNVSLTAGVTGTLPTGSGGTNLTTFTAANNALYSTSASALTAGTLPVAAGGTALTTFTAANNALYSTSASALTAGTLPVAAGGTGATTFTANNVLLGNGTSALQVVAPGTSANVLTSNGTTWGSSSLQPAVLKLVSLRL